MEILIAFIIIALVVVTVVLVTVLSYRKHAESHLSFGFTFGKLGLHVSASGKLDKPSKDKDDDRKQIDQPRSKE